MSQENIFSMQQYLDDCYQSGINFLQALKTLQEVGKDVHTDPRLAALLYDFAPLMLAEPQIQLHIQQQIQQTEQRYQRQIDALAPPDPNHGIKLVGDPCDHDYAYKNRFRLLQIAIRNSTAFREFPVGFSFRDDWDRPGCGLCSAPLTIVDYRKVRTKDGRLVPAAILARNYPLRFPVEYNKTEDAVYSRSWIDHWLNDFNDAPNTHLITSRKYSGGCTDELIEAVTPIMIKAFTGHNDQTEQLVANFFLPSPEEVGIKMLDEQIIEPWRATWLNSWEEYGCECWLRGATPQNPKSAIVLKHAQLGRHSSPREMFNHVIVACAIA